MSDKLLASMTPEMVALLRRIATDDITIHQVHGPMLKALEVRGLVRHPNNRLTPTWAGQKLLNNMED